jgi:polyhydroxyalkanoate synthesis regulator phasin
MYRPKIISKVKARAAKAVEAVAQSEQGAAAIAGALRRVQDGRTKLEEHSTRLLSTLGLATKADVESLDRKVSKLCRQVQALLDQTRG